MDADTSGFIRGLKPLTQKSINFLFRQTRTSKRESVEGCISNKSSWNETVDQLGSDTRERAGRQDVEPELVISMVDLVDVVDAFQIMSVII